MTCPALCKIEEESWGPIANDLEGLLQEADKERARNLPQGQEEVIHQSLVYPELKLHPIDRRRLMSTSWIVSGGSRVDHQRVSCPKPYGSNLLT